MKMFFAAAVAALLTSPAFAQSPKRCVPSIVTPNDLMHLEHRRIVSKQDVKSGDIVALSPVLVGGDSELMRLLVQEIKRCLEAKQVKKAG